jgi:putative DNA methylase
MNEYPKRLIEVDLPIKRISEHARREKSIRHGHISTLHIWWARRPLAACRAVICAALWPDPADKNCPQAFRDKAAEIITDFAKRAVTGNELAGSCAPDTWNKWLFLAKPENRIDATKEPHLSVLRNALLDFIADFANWDNSTNEVYLATSRALTQAAHEAMGGEPGTRPLVVDPFAGGGAIPLEALRVGADAFASDLNPVAVLLNKVLLEYIPKYGQRLSDEVRKWGEWVKREAEKELAEFYPKDPDGATPIAYLWARTIVCEGPNCGAEVPLMRSQWLSKKANRSIALQIIPNRTAKRVDFEIIKKKGRHWTAADDPQTKIENPKFDGTVQRGSATCALCGYTTPVVSVRRQLKERRGGTADARLFCVVTTRLDEQGRFYRLPTERDLEAVRKAAARLKQRKKAHNDRLSLVPDEQISLNEIRRISLPIYGMMQWGDVFMPRQALAMTTLAHLVGEVGRSLRAEHNNGFAIAVQTFLALAVDRQADATSSLCRWHTTGEKHTSTFGRQALPLVWDFSEVQILSESTGGFAGALEWVGKVCDHNSASALAAGTADRATAMAHPLPNDAGSAFISDPPYYDAVPYAYLSDFFYVWLRRMLSGTHPSLFSGEAVPKDDEIVVDRPHELSTSKKDITFYEQALKKAFREGCRVLAPSGIGTIVFASKTTASWEAILQSMVDAGWIITGSWPIDTEMENRVAAQGQARLGSSVHIVCRPRENADASLQADNIGDYRDVLHELPQRMRDWMPRLAAEGIVGADAIFACLGPALEIFSRYVRVEKLSGEAVTLREYLEQVWAAVSKEALNMIFEGADATGFEEDARLTVIWFWVMKAAANGNDGNGTATDCDPEGEEEQDQDETTTSKKKTAQGYAMEFDAARKLAQGLGADLQRLSRPGGILVIKGGTAILNRVADRGGHLFGDQPSLFEEGQRISFSYRRPPQPIAKLKTVRQRKRNLFDPTEIPQPDRDQPYIPGLIPLEDDRSITTRLIDEGFTMLDRLHQAMLLFAKSYSALLRPFLIETQMGTTPRFWLLAQSLSTLYPANSDEKRWVDGVLARKKGMGF